MRLINCHIIIVTVLALACLSTVTFAAYQWSSHSVAIDLDTQDGHITAQTDMRQGSVTITLDVNTAEDAAITADISSASQLTHQRGEGANEDTLVTEYWISTDGDGGTGGTGATLVDIGLSHADDWVTHDLFIATALKITYVSGDDDVEVTLHVRAKNYADEAADSGSYSAIQTLTVTWGN